MLISYEPGGKVFSHCVPHTWLQRRSIYRVGYRCTTEEKSFHSAYSSAA